jgi:DNA-binding MarR family transcriptional regulator
MLISDVFDELVAGLHRQLPEAGFPDIRPAHCTAVFRVIDPDGTRAGELARRAGITPQGMAEFVSYLQARGYVERVHDPNDRRVRIVKLTDRGRAAADAASAAFAAIEANWTERLGTTQMAQLRQLLTDLAIPSEPDAAAH